MGKRHRLVSFLLLLLLDLAPSFRPPLPPSRSSIRGLAASSSPIGTESAAKLDGKFDESDWLKAWQSYEQKRVNNKPLSLRSGAIPTGALPLFVCATPRYACFVSPAGGALLTPFLPLSLQIFAAHFSGTGPESFITRSTVGFATFWTETV